MCGCFKSFFCFVFHFMFFRSLFLGIRMGIGILGMWIPLFSILMCSMLLYIFSSIFSLFLMVICIGNTYMIWFSYLTLFRSCLVLSCIGMMTCWTLLCVLCFASMHMFRLVLLFLFFPLSLLFLVFLLLLVMVLWSLLVRVSNLFHRIFRLEMVMVTGK